MWIPDRDTDGNIIVTLTPFASKKLPNGSLFKRVHGIESTIPANSTGNIDFLVPYAESKFTGAEIINCQLGDSVDFMVLDTPTGTISTVPYSVLNQYGYNVRLPNAYYKNTSDYDASLMQSMTIRCQYSNNSNAEINVYMNIELHEVKP